MRLWTLLAGLAACAVSVQAQNALQDLAKHMPKCSVCYFRPYVRRPVRELTCLKQLACFAEELPKSVCATDLTSQCLCTNVALNAAVAVCAKKTCTIFETLRKKRPSADVIQLEANKRDRNQERQRTRLWRAYQE
jgi:hypothetical protein